MKIKINAKKPPQYLIDQNYRFTIYSSSLIRAEYSKKGMWEDKNPIGIEPSFNEEVTHKIKQDKNSLSISTKHFELKLLANHNPFDIGNFYFKAINNQKDILWQPGTLDKKNIGGAMSDLVRFPEGKSHERFSEGLISKNGYFVFRNPCEFVWDEEKKWIIKKQDWEFQDWYIFTYGNDYKRAFLDFVKLFGKIPIPPKWAFGYWYSKWYKFKDEEILETVKKFKNHQLPLDVFVIDTDWRKHRWNGYEWNKEFFPDPKGFIKKLKDQNIHCCLNDHPGYSGIDEMPADDPFKEKLQKRIPEIQKYRCKWSKKEYVDAWIEEIFSKLLKEGVDFWWVDGDGQAGIPGINSQMWLNKFYFESAKMAGDARRPMILSRWGGIGAHKYPVQFSGDTYSSFETLKYQIAFTHKGGNIGAAYWSHDIGGFLGGKLPDDLFIRWLQFGCFSPIFRTHSSGSEREVWNYSAEVLEVFSNYVRIRYALFPYFYSLAKECFDTGLPLIRGLYLEYSQDKNAYLYEEEYLIGKSLLVAPAYGPGKKFEREIYFPKGAWLALEDKEIIQGPCVKKITIPLTKIPVYIKMGSIIPTSPVKENLSQKISEIEFNIFPESKSEFSYYEDDGVTEDYLKNGFLTQQIIAEKSKKETRIIINPISGNYKGCPKEMNYRLNILTGTRNASLIFVNGEKKNTKWTTKIFSKTVESRFSFLQIELGNRKREERIEIILK